MKNIKNIYHDVRDSAELLHETVKIKNKIRITENELSDIFCEYGIEHYKKSLGEKFDAEFICELEGNIASYQTLLKELRLNYNTLRNLTECPSCKTVSSIGSNFCAHCGAALIHDDTRKTEGCACDEECDCGCDEACGCGETCDCEETDCECGCGCDSDCKENTSHNCENEESDISPEE